MNCSQARALFSARVDFELSGEQSLEHDRHLTTCSSCKSEWRAFHVTVRMIRTLPMEAPNDAFVGQVLDRVRSHEAHPVPTYLEPADRPLPESAAIASPGWSERLRGWIDSLRSPVPAFAMGALALGFIVGFAAMDLRSDTGSSTAGAAAVERSLPVPQMVRGSDVDGDHSVNPFADLADEIGRLPEPSGPLQARESFDVLPPANPDWSWDLGLQQQVRAGDVRPRITF